MRVQLTMRVQPTMRKQLTRRVQPTMRAMAALIGLLASLVVAAPSASASPNQTYYQAFNCPAQTPVFQHAPEQLATSGYWNFRIAPYGAGQDCTWIRTLATGTAVTALARNNNWRYIRIDATGEEGWVHQLALTSRSVDLGPPGSPTGQMTWAVNGACWIQVDTSIRLHIEALLQAATAAGHSTLCGWGFRDPAQQIALRRQNCGTSHYAIWQMPSRYCSPPTAIPGTSMHERGLAVDFYSYGGRSITANEFGWLQRNAARFGLFNFPLERWHWSTNGR